MFRLVGILYSLSLQLIPVQDTVLLIQEQYHKPHLVKRSQQEIIKYKLPVPALY